MTGPPGSSHFSRCRGRRVVRVSLPLPWRLVVGGVRPKSGPETERDDKVLPLNMGWREASVKIRSPVPQKAEAT